MCLLLRRAPLSARVLLTLTHLPASPAHPWQLIIHSGAPATAAHPDGSVRAHVGTAQAGTHTHHSAERRSGGHLALAGAP